MSDDHPDPPKIRAHITIRPDGDDVVASVSDEEGDISVHRAAGANLLSPLERAQLAKAVRMAVEEIVGEAVGADEAMRAPVAATLREIADQVEADAADDEGEATVLRLEPDEAPEEEEDG